MAAAADDRVGHAAYVDNPLTAETEVPVVDHGGSMRTSFSSSVGPDSRKSSRSAPDRPATRSSRRSTASRFSPRRFSSGRITEAPSGGVSLYYVSKVLEQVKKAVDEKKMKEEEYRQIEQEYRRLQEAAIKRYLKEYIKTRLLSYLIRSGMEKEQETR